MSQTEQNEQNNLNNQHDQNESERSINFFLMFRKTGFYDTIRLLSLLPDEKAPQNELSQFAESRGISRNSMDRCRPLLLKYQLIRYELSGAKKVLALTEKGRIVLAKIDEINGMLVRKHKKPNHADRKNLKKKA